MSRKTGGREWRAVGKGLSMEGRSFKGGVRWLKGIPGRGNSMAESRITMVSRKL